MQVLSVHIPMGDHGLLGLPACVQQKLVSVCLLSLACPAQYYIERSGLCVNQWTGRQHRRLL